MEPKLPLEITSGDMLTIPIAMVNSTSDKLSGNIQYQVMGKSIVEVGKNTTNFTIAPQERSRKYLNFEVKDAR